MATAWFEEEDGLASSAADAEAATAPITADQQQLIESAVAAALALERTQAEAVQKVAVEAAVSEAVAVAKEEATSELRKAVADARSAALADAVARAKEEQEAAVSRTRGEVREEEAEARRVQAVGLEAESTRRLAEAA